MAPAHPGARRALRGLALAVLSWALVLLAVAEARADVAVQTPAGWTDGPGISPEASARAQALARAGNMRLASTMSPTAQDEFAETLVVLEAAGTIDLTDGDSAREELERVAGTVIGATGAALETRVDFVAGTMVVRGAWQVGDLMYRAALAPWGPNHALVVMVTRAAEDSLYRAVFADAVAEMTGVTAPIEAFARSTWRLIALLAWLVIAGLVYLVVSMTADRAGDWMPSGRRSAIVLLVVAVLVGAAVYVALGASAEELRLVDVGREWIAAETAGMGVVMAAGVMLISFALARPRQVASAPTGGVYSRGGGGPRGAKLYESTGVQLVKVERTGADTPVDSAPADAASPPAPAPPPAPIELPDLPSEVTPAEITARDAASPSPPEPGVYELPEQDFESVEEVLEQIADEVADGPSDEDATVMRRAPSSPDDDLTVARPAPSAAPRDDDRTVVRRRPVAPVPRQPSGEYSTGGTGQEHPWKIKD